MNPAAYSVGSGAETLTAELFCYQFLIDVSYPLCESPVRPISKAISCILSVQLPRSPAVPRSSGRTPISMCPKCQEPICSS